MTPDARSNHLDPADPFVEDDVDFDDPIERAAIAMHRLTFEVAPEVAGRFAPSGEPALAYTWARLRPPERQRFRRMADVIVRAHETPRGEYVL